MSGLGDFMGGKWDLTGVLVCLAIGGLLVTVVILTALTVLYK